jgi:hypothetical protein
MESLDILMALAALVLPFLFARVIVNHTAGKPSPKHERKSRK